MREPADLPTPRQTEYAERKSAIAQCRANIVDALLSERSAEEAGDLQAALQCARGVQYWQDDLSALLEEWIEDYPPGEPTPFGQVAFT